MKAVLYFKGSIEPAVICREIQRVYFLTGVKVGWVIAEPGMTKIGLMHTSDEVVFDVRDAPDSPELHLVVSLKEVVSE